VVVAVCRDARAGLPTTSWSKGRHGPNRAAYRPNARRAPGSRSVRPGE
jgi:hypothetical protein